MARTLWRMKRGFARVLGLTLIAVLWVLPLAGSLAAFAVSAFEASAWHEILRHPQLPAALLLSVWTGTAGLALALGGALLIAAGLYETPLWHRLQSLAAAGLAIPHLAFAIGFGFLIMPSGLLARLFSGGTEPPSWVTTQDPPGLSLIVCLALKEIPFLIVTMWSVLVQADAAQQFSGRWRSARSLGHGSGSAWLKVLLPQILPRLAWPIAVVWIYGATVVDMALVIGPTQPPTLALIVWSDLNNASAAINARGAAGAMLLTLVLAATALLATFAMPIASLRLHRFMIAGPSPQGMPRLPATLLLWAIGVVYGLVVLMLASMSVSGSWPWPRWLPDSVQLAEWRSLLANAEPAILSLAMGLATSGLALALAVLWFETMPPRFDRALTAAAVVTLGLPTLAVASGQYRLFLWLDLNGGLPGLFLAHFTAVYAYVFIVLKGPYRAFDPRFRAVAVGLNRGELRFWFIVKAPILKAALAIAAAVGFAVSAVQFVPAQLIAAGRYSTLPMEAVTLASGGDRALTAAYALALAVLTGLAFLMAQVLGTPRWRQAWS